VQGDDNSMHDSEVEEEEEKEEDLEENYATSFIDGSTIYGSESVRESYLRTFHNGQLRTFNHSVTGAQLLPIADNSTTLRMTATARVRPSSKF
jgi:Animal haem peroxidase